VRTVANQPAVNSILDVQTQCIAELQRAVDALRAANVQRRSVTASDVDIYMRSRRARFNS
jgi:hypothetical protein